MRKVAAIGTICSFALLTGCNTIDTPLVFGKVNTFGASVSATAPDQGGNVTLGYRSANIAIVPVTARDTTGRVTPVLADQQSAAQRSHEAFSTFAHFEAGVSTPGTACLGDTFATGYAARFISQNLPKVCNK